MPVVDPVQFFWNRAGIYMLPESEWTGDAHADASKALSAAYPSAYTDEERLRKSLDDILRGRSTDTILKWAKSMAAYDVAKDVIDRSEPDLPADALAALKQQVGKVKRKPSGVMDGSRLTQNNLILVREDAKSLVVTNQAFAKPDALDVRHCGVKPYWSYVADLIVSPPDGPFMLIECSKAAVPLERLVVNLSPERIFTHLGTYYRQQILDAYGMIDGARWGHIDKLSKLFDVREKDVSRIEKIDAELDKVAARLPQGLDIYDLLDVLPIRDSLSWTVLRSMHYAREASQQGSEE